MTCQKDNTLDTLNYIKYIMGLISPVSFYLFFNVATKKPKMAYAGYTMFY